MASASAQTEVVSATQASPGKVVARTRVDASSAPQASEFAMRLDGASEIPATKLDKAPPEANSAALLICVDRSGSMGPAAIKAMREALQKALVPRSGETRLPMKVAIVAFGTQSSHLLGLSSDPAMVADAIGRITLEREGRTRLNDAVAGGLAELRSSDATWKRLLVVSDGNDEGSSLSREALIERASARPAVAIDAVGFGALAASASGVMSTLAGATGGRFAVANNRNELADALGKFINQAVPQPLYDVTFDYAAAPDGRRAEAPALLFRPKGGPAVSVPLKAEVAAVAPAGVSSTTANTPAPPPPPASWFASIRESIAHAPMAVKIGIGLLLLLLVLLVVFVFLRRRREDEPAAPEMGPQVPLAPTHIGDSMAATAVPPPGGNVPRRPTLIAYRWPLPGERRTIAIVNGLTGVAQGVRYLVTASPTRIGAAPENDLILNGDDFISGRHLALKAEANALYVTDLGSRNGSELNGVSFTGATRSVSPGDVVTLGRSTFEILSPDTVQSAGRSAFEPRVS
ncbi:FHA domain-containing protein [Variovorax sp. GT1P44]|uniref:FHA domain-containing protein n=1 Tax=Variovorax sp. GT1P44 TaxID=3443742 RepID=UPI003F46F429